ncbi:hypothetical protein M0R45_006480 [Rubus argutus]|uniref:Uncharacterized protein n=1 Tax=Rubus argutus TaxID=59490 RepID=A0AAW1YQN2_RUBAR
MIHKHLEIRAGRNPPSTGYTFARLIQRQTTAGNSTHERIQAKDWGITLAAEKPTRRSQTSKKPNRRSRTGKRPE